MICGDCANCTHDFRKERLFRGKRIDNGEWHVGSYIWEAFRHDGDQKVRVIALNGDEGMAHVDPKTIGEFTGALTGNGTRIFEGDIIDIPHWVVTYADGMNCCYGMQVGWYIQRDNWESWMELENTDRLVIIGNIHDNPELLE